VTAQKPVAKKKSLELLPWPQRVRASPYALTVKLPVILPPARSALNAILSIIKSAGRNMADALYWVANTDPLRIN